MNDDKSLATRVGEGAIWFGWLGLLFAWIYIAYTFFNEFNPNELGVSSMHPLLYGYIIKFFYWLLITRNSCLFSYLLISQKNRKK